MRKYFRADHSFGKRGEESILPRLREIFGQGLQASKSNTAHFDFVGEGLAIEMKTRRAASYTYPTTIVAMNKIEHAREFLAGGEGRRVLFIFKFNDMTLGAEFPHFEYYTETLRCKNGRSGRPHAFIDIRQLKALEDLGDPPKPTQQSEGLDELEEIMAKLSVR